MNLGKRREREREQKKEQLVAGSARRSVSKTQRDAGNSMVNAEQWMLSDTEKLGAASRHKANLCEEPWSSNLLSGNSEWTVSQESPDLVVVVFTRIWTAGNKLLSSQGFWQFKITTWQLTECPDMSETCKLHCSWMIGHIHY